MSMTEEEAQECIGFQKNVLLSMKTAIKMAGGSPFAEAAAEIGIENHKRTLKALEEYHAYLVSKRLLEG